MQAITEHRLRLTKQLRHMSVDFSARNEAVEALVALGYARSEAFKAVRAVDISDNNDSEYILKQALKKLAFM